MGSQLDSSSQSHPCAEKGPQPSSLDALSAGGVTAPAEVLLGGLTWTRMGANSLPSLYEELATIEPPTRKPWRVGLHVGGACFYLFTDLPHPEATAHRGLRTATYVFPMNAFIEASAKSVMCATLDALSSDPQPLGSSEAEDGPHKTNQAS